MDDLFNNSVKFFNGWMESQQTIAGHLMKGWSQQVDSRSHSEKWDVWQSFFSIPKGDKKIWEQEINSAVDGQDLWGLWMEQMDAMKELVQPQNWFNAFPEGLLPWFSPLEWTQSQSDIAQKITDCSEAIQCYCKNVMEADNWNANSDWGKWVSSQNIHANHVADWMKAFQVGKP